MRLYLEEVYMHLHVSTLTQKGQTTIPVDIRHELDLRTGDKIEFKILAGKVILKKMQPINYEYHRALAGNLSEWNSLEDDEAFNDL
jgi:antitoxin PrlF